MPSGSEERSSCPRAHIFRGDITGERWGEGKASAFPRYIPPMCMGIGIMALHIA